MFAIFRISLFLIALGLFRNSIAHDEVSVISHDFICGLNNICSAFFEEKINIVSKLCDPSRFSVVWNKGSKKYLFLCRGEGAAEEGARNWLVDAQNDIFYRVGYGRFYDRNALISKPNIKIPDGFQARPLCHPANDAQLRASDFVLLNKRPADDEQNSYCYEPTYLTVSGGKMHVSTIEGELTNDDATYQVHNVTENEKACLQFLLKSLN
jgi:hypothetical protein